MAMEKKRAHDEAVEEAESEVDSPEVKRLRENLLDGFDDEPEFCAASQELDSFMKSFEEEIAPSPSAAAAATAEILAADQASYSGDARPDLGYLLEASDDELGIPPPPTSAEEVNDEIAAELCRVESESSEFWDIPSYDPLGFGFGFGESDNYSNCEYVGLDGLFVRSDPGLGPGDITCRSETLPAQ